MSFPLQPILPVLATARSSFARLPAELDGSQGRNRATGHAQTEATNDIEAVQAWLAAIENPSSATIASYRKEVERLLLWATLQQTKALSDLTHEDFAAYRTFLADPQPASFWVTAKKGMKPSRRSADWRPFAGPLSQSSQRQAINIINNLYSWLVQAGYLTGNPLSLRRGRKKPEDEPFEARRPRALSDELWRAVKQTIDSMPQEDKSQEKRAAQVRWLFSLLFLCGLRISEVANGTMGDFKQTTGDDGVSRWWLHVFGKGNKRRRVPATADLMQQLGRYRASLGLSPLPYFGEQTPLVASRYRKDGQALQGLTRAALHQIVKTIAESTAARLRPNMPDLANHMAQMSAHWLRHTAATKMSNKMDLKFARDNLGHSNISTTNIYLHSEDAARHDATSEALRLDWRG